MHTLKTVRAIGLLLVLFSFSAVSYAQRDRWEYLGEANVDGQVDHDNIMVTKSKGAYRAIVIRVLNAPVEFDRVVVHFGNGSSDPIEIRSVIAPGGQTRVIDLPGERRIIERVEFWYARAARRVSRRPKVRLFGLH